MTDITQAQLHPRVRYLDRNGQPLAGGKVYAYELGTTIAKATYSDATGLVPNAQPIVLDSAGQANIFGSGLYTLIILDANDVPVDSIDGEAYYSEGSEVLSELAGTTGAGLVGFLQKGVGAVPRTVQDKLRDVVSVEDFGVVGGLDLDDISITQNTTRMQTALDAVAANGGGILNALQQYYVFNGTLRRSDGVVIKGSGVGSWDCVIHNRIKGWEGTNFIFKGTGEKTSSFNGITDQSTTGGWRPDDVNPALCYKLTNLMNSDANPSTGDRATPRPISAAITVISTNNSHGEMTTRQGGLSHLRIVPWMGVDGTSDYSNPMNMSIGDDWDVGYLCLNTEYDVLDCVQIVGYWRIAALAEIQCGVDTYGAGERNRRLNIKLQGYRGLLERATDLYQIINATASTITIPWTSSHYWPSTGLVEVPGGADFSYTGITVSGDQLTFTGVLPDAAGKTGSQLRSTFRGTGVAGSIYQNCMIHALNHISGLPATMLGFSDPSIGHEVHGFPMRGKVYIDFKVQLSSGESCNAFYGNVDDTTWIGSQHETGKVIATPFYTEQSWAAYPVFNTTDMRLYGHTWSATKPLFTPRTYFDDGEVLGVKDTTRSDYTVKSQKGRVFNIQKEQSVQLNFVDYDYTALAGFTSVGGNFIIYNDRQLSFSGLGTAFINAASGKNITFRQGTTALINIFGLTGTLAPANDGTQALGAATARWSTLYAATPTINTSDARLKQHWRWHSEAERAAAIEIKSSIGNFKYTDAIDMKGDGARWHTGVKAQEVIHILTKHGLDPMRYAFVCYDEWDEVVEVRGKNDDIIVPHTLAGNMFGIRYEELAMFILAAL